MCVCVLTDACPWLLPPLDATALKAGVTLRLQYRLLLGWYEAAGPLMLTAPVLRHAIAVHCRLPLFPVPVRCQYVTLTSGTACMHPLDPHGSHIHACAFGPRQRRHDAMRDAWCSLLRRAGWTVGTEQLVHTAPHASKRADLLVTTPGGLAYALDLTFTAPLDDAAPSGPHLHRVHQAKAARYGVPAGQPLPHGTTLLPITFAATRPFMHSHAVHLLYRAILAAAGSLDASARGFLLSSLTAEFAATLGHCFQTWAWRMAFSCQPR